MRCESRIHTQHPSTAWYRVAQDPGDTVSFTQPSRHSQIGMNGYRECAHKQGGCATHTHTESHHTEYLTPTRGLTISPSSVSKSLFSTHSFS